MDDVFTTLRPLLFSVAYRMMGSRADAEDVVQDAFLRWQLVDRTAVQSPRAYLITVVSRLSLDALQMAYRRREVYVGPWLPEPLVGPTNEPAELAESLSFAFLHVLESLTPRERAAFLMREVFDADYADVAGVLNSSEANARQVVARARQRIHDRRPRQHVDPAKHRQLLDEFVCACAAGDATILLGLLQQDATLYSDGGGKRQAALNPIEGAAKIVRFLQGILRKSGGSISGHQVGMNGENGWAVAVDGKFQMLLTIGVGGDQIASVFLILNPDKLPNV